MLINFQSFRQEAEEEEEAFSAVVDSAAAERSGPG